MAVDKTKVRALQGAVLRQAVAGGTGSLGDAVYISDDTNNLLPTVVQADANVSATVVAARGIVVAMGREGETDFVSGDALTIATFGPVAGYSGLTPGARQYVSSTVGALTESAPSGAGTWTWAVGYAESDGVVFVNPGIQAPASNS